MSNEPNPSRESGDQFGERIPPGAEVYLRKPPYWSYFLTPAAVFLGALVIAASIYFTAEDNSTPAATPDDMAVVPGGATTVEPGALTPVPTQAPAASLLETFNGYAESLGMDGEAFNQCLGQQSNVVLLNDHVQRGASLGVSGTPTFFINNKRLVGAQDASILEEIVQKELSGTPPTSLDEYSDAVRSLGSNFSIVDGRPDLTGAIIEGNPEAPVMIAEFSDFQCPFCKRWSEQVLPALRSQLGDQVALAFLHFPISQIHPNAGNASVVAVCAGEQGKFWEMHDLLFARQAEWSNLR